MAEYKKEECRIKIGEMPEPSMYLHSVPNKKKKTPTNPNRLTPEEIEALRGEAKKSAAQMREILNKQDD